MQWFLGRFPGAVAGVANAARALVVGNRRSSVASEIYTARAFRRRFRVILVRRDSAETTSAKVVRSTIQLYEDCC